MQRPVRKLVVSCLFTCITLARAQRQFHISECPYPNAFTVGDGNKFSLTCTGLHHTSNIYWSVSSPHTNVTEIRLGECKQCDSNCSTTNCTVFNRDYSISRPQSNITILKFVDNLEQNQGALVKCSQINNHTNSRAYCPIEVLNETRRPELSIKECRNGIIEVFPNQSTSLTCTGLWPQSNIYWSLTGPSTDGTEIRLGDCPVCYPSCSNSPCDDVDNRYGYPISRSRYDFTTLELVTSAQVNDKDTLKCSQWNNDTTAQSTCSIRLLTDYRLPQCMNGQLDVSAEEPWTPIVCEDVRSVDNIQWIITNSINRTTIADCKACDVCDDACNVTTDDVIAFRTATASELRIVGNVREKNNSTVTCVRKDGATQDSCRIRDIYGPTEVTLSGHLEVNKGTETAILTCTYDEVFPGANVTWSVDCDNYTHLAGTRNTSCRISVNGMSAAEKEVSCTVSNSFFPHINRTASYTIRRMGAEGMSSFPLIPVAGGAGAAFLVVVFIIVVVIIVMRGKKQRKRQPETEGTINPSFDVGYSELDTREENGTPSSCNNLAVSDTVARPATDTEGYTYVNIDEGKAQYHNTAGNGQQAKRIQIQGDGPSSKQSKGENRGDDDFEEYINELYDSYGNTLTANGKALDSTSTSPLVDENTLNPDQPASTQPQTPVTFQAHEDNVAKSSSQKSRAGSSIIGPKGDVYTRVSKVKKTEPRHSERGRTDNSQGETAKEQTTSNSVPASVEASSSEGEAQYINSPLHIANEGQEGTEYVNVSGSSVLDKDAQKVEGSAMTEDEYNRLRFARSQAQDDPHYNHLSKV